MALNTPFILALSSPPDLIDRKILDYSVLGGMRASVSILFTAAMFAFFAQQSRATLTNKVVLLHTNFIADARLNAAELSNVVELANMCGIEQVADVRTFHCLPTSYRGIEVVSTADVSGRNVTYKTLEVFREGWSYESKPIGPLQTISVGPFWVRAFSIGTTHKATLFNTANGVIPVEVEAGISTNVADTIIIAFTSTNFFVQDRSGFGDLDRLIKSEKLSQPNRLINAGTDGHYAISFSDDGNIYECVLSSNKVSVLSFNLPPTP